MIKIFKDSIQYGYAVGRVKVLEKRMIDSNKAERILMADNLDEQLKILAETEYAPFLPEKVETTKQVDDFLANYLSYLFLFLGEITDLPELIHFFRAEYDFHNLKAILQEPAQEALDILQSDKDYFLLDSMIDCQMYTFLKNEANLLKCEYLNQLMRIMIDGANIKAFLRSLNIPNRYNYLTKFLISGGEIFKEDLIKLGGKEIDEVAQFISRTLFKDIAGFLKEDQDLKLNYLDRELDNVLIIEARPARYLSSGLEPVVGYLIGKKYEIINLRLLLIGKLGGLSKVELKDYLRDLYV